MKFHDLRIFIIFFFVITSLQLTAQKLAVTPYVSGINSPIDIKHGGDDRLFVADKGGLIRIINADGTLRPAAFLDISSKVHQAPEDGLLGLAFSPNYKTDRKFYVDYTALVSGVVTTIIEEYKVNASDSNAADLSSALTILTQPQPYDNHVGGNLMFGKDGYLYINFGDGDSERDPNGYGQNKTTFLGKILRIDVSNSSLAQPYSIPSSNPFYNDATPGIKKETWASGMRNPWRSSVDKLTGDIWIADVGQGDREEIDYQPVNHPGGRNYGWNTMEGNSCLSPSTGCNTPGLTEPIYDYTHSNGNQAVIGGYVCRSGQSKSLFGTYIFADWAGKWIDGIQQSAGALSGSVKHLIAGVQGFPICFGEDNFGDHYILFQGDGSVYKLQDTSHLRRPKAYFTAIDLGTGSFLFQGLQGRNLNYQWLRDNVVIQGATSPEYVTSSTGSYSLVVTNTLNFSDTSSVFNLGALPLNLTSFIAQKILANKIRLQWKTRSEQNISGYAIMRRQDNEAFFSIIGFVDSKAQNGTSNTELDYAFTDSSTLNYSKLFYRLQVQSADGSYSWSDIRTITADVAKHNFVCFPNPATGQVNISLDNFTQPVIMTIYDNAGRKLKEQTLDQQITTVELRGLRGIFIVQIGDKDGSNISRRKLVIR